MSTDLVARLRFRVLDRTNGSEQGMMRTMGEAADEIERLLEILREVRANVRSVDLMNARDAAGNFTDLSGRIDAALAAHTRPASHK